MLDEELSDRISALWLETLQTMVRRSTHDVRDALNGVSVNLEVIRGRAARPDVPASALASFAESAVQQLDRVTALSDAVLSTARAAQEPTDVLRVLRHLAVLCTASSSAGAAAIHVVDEAGDLPATTPLRADVVRLALGASMLDLVEESRSERATAVKCTLRIEPKGVAVALFSGDRTPVVSTRIAAALERAGVQWKDGPSGLTLTFPRS